VIESPAVRSGMMVRKLAIQQWVLLLGAAAVVIASTAADDPEAYGFWSSYFREMC